MKSSSRNGQIALFLAFVILGLVLLLMLEMDIFLSVRGKTRIQNAGDAAALAAARWQGLTLNLIGDLNLCHLAAACESNEVAEAGIVALQERLAFTGPLMGMAAANLAARENGLAPDPGMTRLVQQAASDIAACDDAASLLNSDSWPSKASDYVTMLQTLVTDGIAAGCDNARYFDFNFSGSHFLYMKAFYEAVDGEDWCWFWFYYGGEKAIAKLMNFTGWGDIPKPEQMTRFSNPEFYGIAIDSRITGFPSPDAEAVLLAAAEQAGLDPIVTAEAIEACGVLVENRFPWYLYDTSDWRAWTEVDPTGPDRFPLASSVKSEYNLYGCAAASRVSEPLIPFSTSSETNDFVWVAAAKPFGCTEIGGRKRPVTTLFETGYPPLVLPDFTDVRLIPLGGVGESRLNMADETWINHCRDHVPELTLTDDCRFCRTLKAWNAGLPQKAAMWLQLNGSERCVRGSGPSPTGGTRHAH